ncbi:hypothetical protein ACG3SL_01310 [Sphingomonas sp. CJ20]
MEWIVTACVTVALGLALPRAIVAAKKSVRGNGRMAGAALSIGLAFSAIFDPRKQEAIENIGKRVDEDENSLRDQEPAGGGDPVITR